MLGDPRSEAPPWQEKVTKAPPALKMLNHLDIDINIWSKIFEGLNKLDFDSPIFDVKVFTRKKDRGATSAEIVATLKYQYLKEILFKEKGPRR